MSMPNPDDRGPRTSRAVKLVLMGVAGAALLYSCAPGIGTAVGGWPGFWFWGNPFYRGPVFSSPGSSVPATPGTTSGPTTSQRGGFGGSAGEHGSIAS